MVTPGVKFRFDTEQKMSTEETWKIAEGLLNKYDIPPEWITETFGVPVEKKEVPPALAPFQGGKPPVPGDPVPEPEEVMNRLRELYGAKGGMRRIPNP